MKIGQFRGWNAGRRDQPARRRILRHAQKTDAIRGRLDTGRAVCGKRPPRTALVLVLLGVQWAATRAAEADEVVFSRDVAPILRTECLTCHNHRDRRGGLSLETRRALLQGGESGAVVVPGEPEVSYLLDLLEPTDGHAEMPKQAKPLQEGQIAIIRNWIEAGAKWPDQITLAAPVVWSLKPVRRPQVPRMAGATSDVFPVRNPIDSFVQARLAQAGLKPAKQADMRTLIRRLYLDLTGLPPEPAAVDAFVANPSADSYEQLVDDLLASPHFGEHWGRHWLDLARYADSEGYLGDSERPHAWVYRDWVIDAINRDLPFDQFTIEQLAGDLLANPTVDQKIATGFHRNTLRNTEAGVDLELYRTKEIVDRVNTTGMVWLGLTLGCAECHDHKNDPISQREFYQLYAFFNNADEVGVPANRPWQIAEFERANNVWQKQWDELQQQLKPLETKDLSDGQHDEVQSIFDGYKKPADLNRLETFYRTTEPEWKKLRAALETHLASKPVPSNTKARAFAERTDDRRETYVHVRGVYNRRGASVTPGTPAVLPLLQADHAEPSRLDLARWLFREDNPLTARVAVNRTWQHLFGQGIVSTSNDFGSEGAEPSHPLLLDWLATEYRRLGWSRKAMIRTIVLSSTYRLSSAATAVPGQNDVGNLLLWRQNSFRVGAETVRDLHLAASGLLNRTIGRPGIRPPLPKFVTSVGRSVKWPVTKGADQYRRGMYIFFKRTVPYPMLMTFDAPDATVSCSRRERSNTPLQALTLLNDPVFYECAQALGNRAQEAGAGDVSAAVRFMFARCLSRPPTEQELSCLLTAYCDILKLKQSERSSASAETTEIAPKHRESEAAALTLLARIVMNLDEFVTRD